MKLNLPFLREFDNFFLKTQKLEYVQRWKGYFYEGSARKENSLQHSFNSLYLAIQIVKAVKKSTNNQIDSDLIYEAVFHHDLGEIGVGDVLYHNKTREKQEQEKNHFLEIIKHLPNEFEKNAEKAYNLQYTKNSLEARIFEAIERYGYVVFAYGEYIRDNQEKLLTQVLRNQHNPLKELAEEIPGFRQNFYNQQTQKKIEDFLEKNKEKYIKLPKG